MSSFHVNDPDIASSGVLAENTNTTLPTNDGERAGKQTRKAHKIDRDDSGDASNDGSTGPRKKRRVAGGSSSTQGRRGKRKAAAPKEYKGVRGKRGLLEKLTTEVPLELVLEVFKFLEPLDILHLSRTSKQLRRILMSRSSADIWRAVLANIEDLPPLPADLNEPQYASLAFDSYCHKCMRNGCEIIIWQYRMRCCKKCIPTVFCTWSKILDYFPILEEDEKLEEIYYKIMSTCSIHLDFEFEGIKSPWPDYDEAFLLSDVADLIIEVQSHLEASTVSELEPLLQSRYYEYMTVHKHAFKCVRWHQSRMEQRLDKLAEAKSKRKNAIIQKLEDLGWGDTVQRLMKEWTDIFSQHKLVNQSRDLTERVWNNIKNPLLEFLAEQKIRLNEEERAELLKDIFDAHCKSIDPKIPVPTFGDAVVNNIFDGLWEVIPDQEDDSIRERLLERLLPFFLEWRSQAQKKVLEIVQAEVPTTTSDLALAKTIFECTLCNESYLWYSDLFHHRCATLLEFGENYSEFNLPENVYDMLFPQPWEEAVFDYSHEASRKIIRLMEACGLDPSTTTVDDLHVQNPLMECVDCHKSKPQRGRVFMRWERALLHDCDNIVPLEDEVLQKYRDKIELWDRFDGPRLLDESYLNVCCTVCHRRGAPRDIKDHLKNEHGVTQMTRQHFRWTPGIEELSYRCSHPLMVTE